MSDHAVQLLIDCFKWFVGVMLFTGICLLFLGAFDKDN
jgi:hypothetical protein